MPASLEDPGLPCALPAPRSGEDRFVPDGTELGAALARTTHLGVGAHADDLEILAIHGILECYAEPGRWFSGVIVTDGAGSVRNGPFARHSDAELVCERQREQRRAAELGQYAAQLQLGFSSAELKGGSEAERRPVVDLLEAVLRASRPEYVYTHNLADRHDTHVAVALRLLEACRRLEPTLWPRQIWGCEVWRDLDWLEESDRRELPVDEHEELQSALLGVFESQIAGGKRYDLGTLGRRRAHATFGQSHAADSQRGLVYAMDLTSLLDSTKPEALLTESIRRFERDVLERLRRLGG